MNTIRLSTIALALLLVAPVAFADAPRSYRYVAGSGFDVAGEHSGGCNAGASVNDVTLPARGGVCLDLPAGTYTIRVTDDVRGPVGFTVKGDGPREPVLVLGVVFLERTSDCGLFVHAEGVATVTLPEGCGLDIHVDVGSAAGTITIA